MAVNVKVGSLLPFTCSIDTDAYPEFHMPKVDSIETDDEMAVGS